MRSEVRRRPEREGWRREGERGIARLSSRARVAARGVNLSRLAGMLVSRGSLGWRFNNATRWAGLGSCAAGCVGHRRGPLGIKLPGLWAPEGVFQFLALELCVMAWFVFSRDDSKELEFVEL